MIALVQPFGLNIPCGGPRILRSVLRGAPCPVLSISAGVMPPPSTDVCREIHIPIRPHFGRIESTRFGGYAWLGAPFYARGFRARLADAISSVGATVVHAVPHGLDFWHAFEVAQKLGIGYVLNVHDELDYNLRGRPDLRKAEKRLAQAWRAAHGRLVISDAMGVEYCRRYGEAPYRIVTDGLQQVPDQPIRREPGSVRIYFMGLFHRSYDANVAALMTALKTLREKHPDVKVTLTCRSGGLPDAAQNAGFPVTVLPLASEEQVVLDMADADLLYLPLPFEPEFRSFVKFSLSTKMVSYLGSGLPILYHGPRDAAAGQVLCDNDAAVAVPSVDPQAVVDAILRVSRGEASAITANALALARRQFLLSDQRRSFWGLVEQVDREVRLGRQAVQRETSDGVVGAIG